MQGHLHNLPYSIRASPGAAIVGPDMLFDIPFRADWNKIGEYGQHQTDQNMEQENCSHHDWDYEIGDQALLIKYGILHKGESWYKSDPWIITSVHTNGTISVQCEQNLNDYIYKE